MTSPASLKREKRDFSEQTIAVEVGSERTSFLVHPSILSKNSKILQSCSRTQPHSTPTSPTSTPAATFRTLQAPSSDFNAIKHHLTLLSTLFILGERIDDTCLRNTVIKYLLLSSGRTGYCYVQPLLTLAFSNSASHPDSTLRAYLVDAALAYMMPEWLEANWAILPGEFLRLVMVGWARGPVERRGGGDGLSIGCCSRWRCVVIMSMMGMFRWRRRVLRLWGGRGGRIGRGGRGGGLRLWGDWRCIFGKGEMWSEMCWKTCVEDGSGERSWKDY
ncbi:hypothetical protein CLAFUW4_07466 [Fulvia fulva]|uniref:BTB domain-containing protein n=1 Tax=Passalora fulva TaxID=5499 RepID=A0A9Q8UQN0_PASFU|nr:uncharacterized protein CLAFUR5_07596 [Fulvia fulva]KAK4623280.1 hypothetical protein CLAFUR0_07472 [Fulvia fulva]UJO18851.1 hypothetical protein CLAFUR5_07596 [Fulvia fulva]WPV15973.1 hypothetical protein CLAFUW4_07466 [Fulvia fulva]WPV31167.1 hypothetical protein CLAFUW7_07468 [Fulvia fulva]